MITPMMSVPTKQCVRCEKKKPTALFSRDRRASDGLYSACKTCNAKASREKRAEDPTASRAAVARWKQANPEAAARHVQEWHDRNPNSRKIAAWRGHLKSKYGLTPEEYADRLRDVTHCSICKRSREEIDRSLHLDHDHETGELRDFLCSQCNQAIGLLGDDPNRVLEAAMYLMRHKRVLESFLRIQEGIK